MYDYSDIFLTDLDKFVDFIKFENFMVEDIVFDYCLFDFDKIDEIFKFLTNIEGFTEGVKHVTTSA